MSEINTETTERETEQMSDGRQLYQSQQETESKTWHIPTSTLTDLRDYVVGLYGTTKHMGAFCTVAMKNWQQSEPTDETHTTWALLKEGFNYDHDLTGLNYRTRTDYTNTNKSEKTAFGFNVPTAVVQEFTAGLQTNEYGSELANAVESELRKRAQIEQMKEEVRDSRAQPTDDGNKATAPKVRVNESGQTVDVDAIRLENTTLTKTEAEARQIAHQEAGVDWQTRRGLLGAIARGSEVMTKNRLYTLDSEAFGVDKARSRRKDFNAIVEQAQKETDPLTLSPAHHLLNHMDEVNLAQAMGATRRSNPCKYESDSLDLLPLKVRLYNSNKTSEAEVLEELTQFVWDYGAELVHQQWQARHTVRKVYNGKHLSDALSGLLPVVTALLELDGSAYYLPVNLEGDLQKVETQLQKKRDHINKKSGGDVEERYTHFKENGTKPKSIEWRKNH